MNCKDQHIYPLVKPFLLMSLILFVLQKLPGQIKDTSHMLTEILIVENKDNLLQGSRKKITVDSLSMAQFRTSSLTELLTGMSAIHVKSYGPGNIGSTSIRGGNSNQTAILWNGLNINSPGLGMYDLSLIPTSFFDDLSLEYGSGSALWGSGAVGGAIHLNNKSLFNRGFHSKLTMSLGSFGSHKISTGVLLSGKKLISNTKLYYQSSLNNFNYKDTLDKEKPDKTMHNASYLMQGLLQELSFLIDPYQKINIRCWYNYSFRNLPTFYFINNLRNQTDQNLKLSADWTFARHRLKSVVRTGYFDDENMYVDSLRKTNSKNQTHTFIVENENTYQLRHHSINVGVNYTSYVWKSQPNAATAISTLHDMQKLGIFASYRLTVLNSKLTYNASIRKEFTSLTEIPFTGNTGIRYQFFSHTLAKVNASSSYRQPTMNDLFWQPGGNPKLKPEKAYELEGGIEFKKHKNLFYFSIEANYFDRYTTNWIAWLPSEKGYSMPVNIAEVYSRGTETKTDIHYTKKNLLIKFGLNTAYILSTYHKNLQENDNSMGRQLIFTPRYSGQASLLIQYYSLNLLYTQNYTGYRFTSSDNTTWMLPYYVSNLKGAYQYHIGNTGFEVFGSINNIFNANYMVMPGSPMPFRNYEIGLSMNYHKIKKSETKKNN